MWDAKSKLDPLHQFKHMSDLLSPQFHLSTYLTRALTCNRVNYIFYIVKYTQVIYLENDKSEHEL